MYITVSEDVGGGELSCEGRIVRSGPSSQANLIWLHPTNNTPV